MTSRNPPSPSSARGLALLPAALLLAACGDGPLPPFEAAPADPVAGAASTASAPAGTASGAVLARIRAATAAYHDIAAAEAAGFGPASGCVAVPGVGGMGFHYLDPARLGDAVVDPSSPELLLYEPRTGGRLRLVGVEFLLIADAWDASHQEPPSLLGQPFDEHRGADTHGLPFDHYELHVWSWRHNPGGLTAPFNPEVSCHTG